MTRRPSAWIAPTAITCILLPLSYLWVLDVLGLRVWSVDFFAYRYAAETALQGHNVYDAWVRGPSLQGGLPFTYTPFALLLLLPVALGPELLLYALWSVMSAVFLAAALAIAVPSLRQRWYRLPLTLAALLPTGVLTQHLMFGQINTFLLALCVAGYALIEQHSRRGDPARTRLLRWAGPALIGIATAVKLTPGLFIVFLALRGKWREALMAGASTALCFAIAAAAFPQASWTFFTSILWDLSARVDLNGVFARPMNQSLPGMMAAIAPGNHAASTVAVAVTGTAGLGLAWLIARRDGLVRAAVVVGITATWISPVSWIHHWVYLLPALVIVFLEGRWPWRVVCAVLWAGIVLDVAPKAEHMIAAHPEVTVPLFVLREWLIVSGAVLALGLWSARPRVPWRHAD